MCHVIVEQQTDHVAVAEIFTMFVCRFPWQCWPMMLQWASLILLSMSCRCAISLLLPEALPFLAVPFPACPFPPALSRLPFSPCPCLPALRYPSLPGLSSRACLLLTCLAGMVDHTLPTSADMHTHQAVQQHVDACSTLPTRRLKERQTACNRRWTVLCSSSDCM